MSEYELGVIGEGTLWSGFVGKWNDLRREYVLECIDRTENVTRKQLERNFLRRIAKECGAEVYFNDEARAG